MVLGHLRPLAGGGLNVKLAQAISQASLKELGDLAHYVANEVEMEGVDLGEGKHEDIPPEAVKSAIQAWAFMQLNARDGTD